MLPRWHIIYGALFVLILGVAAPSTPILYLAALFFAAVFIDLDHYFQAVHKTKRFSLLHAFDYHRKAGKEMLKKEAKGEKPKSDFHAFHTIEFHVLIGVLGIYWPIFFYLFLGMVFHSFLDLFDLLKAGKVHRREYFFFKWLGNKF